MDFAFSSTGDTARLIRLALAVLLVHLALIIGLQGSTVDRSAPPEVPVFQVLSVDDESPRTRDAGTSPGTGHSRTQNTATGATKADKPPAFPGLQPVHTPQTRGDQATATPSKPTPSNAQANAFATPAKGLPSNPAPTTLTANLEPPPPTTPRSVAQPTPTGQASQGSPLPAAKTDAVQSTGLKTSTSEPSNTASNAAPSAAPNTPPAAAGTPINAIGRAEPPQVDAAYQNRPPLDYPRISRQRGEQGRVLVRVLVGSDGQAQKVELQSSSGYARLDQAALNSVERWRFTPGRSGGVAQAMWFTVPVNFVLNPSP